MLLLTRSTAQAWCLLECNTPKDVAVQAAYNIYLKATHKFVALIAGVILLVTLMLLVSFQIYSRIEATNQARKNTHTLISRADAFLTQLKDAATAQRGYALTGNEAFLKSYLALRDGIRNRLEELRPLTLNGAGRKHLDAMAPLVDAKLAELAQVIELRRNQDLAGVVAAVSSGYGTRLMDSIRAEMGSFIKIQEGMLNQHDAEFQSTMLYLFALIVAASVFTLLLAIFFAYLIYRESQQAVKNSVHLETQHLLDAQTRTNEQLQQANFILHLSEERLAVTLNSIDDAVIATDAIGRVTLLNPLAERLTGWARSEAFNHPVEEVLHLIHADTRQPYPVPVKETLAQGATLSLANNTIVVARDGSECDIADSCAPIRDRNGLVVGAVLVFRDVTERKRLDQALHSKNAELESARSVADKANLAKSDFLSSMSHELRTPLSAILGFAQLMEAGSPQPTPSQKRSIGQILKAGWYLLELINEILDLALIESGKLSLSMEPMSLAEVMHECQSLIEPLAQKHGISVAFPPIEIACFVNADRTRVKQTLVNLLSNAIKYNTVGGSVVVDCIITSNPHHARVSVRDTGAGLSPEKLAQLFQPFNRLGQEASAEEGTGIGLVMTKRLIELMGGTIGVESTVGKGSKFWIELNLTAEPHSVAGTGKHTGVAQLRGQTGAQLHTLLYVEDNPANLMLVEDIIERRPDIRMLSARDAIRGIEIARTAQPDIILMDINLPGISGTQALDILAADPVTAHIPVVALSANAMPRDIEKGLEAGFFRYLTKPIKVDVFLDTLDVALKFAETQA